MKTTNEIISDLEQKLELERQKLHKQESARLWARVKDLNKEDMYALVVLLTAHLKTLPVDVDSE